MAHWYFAYGANTASQVLARRGIRPLASEAARLPGFRLAFEEPGIPILEPAFASLTPAPGATVHGVLHRLSAEHLALLDAYEGPGYDRGAATVTGVRAGPVQATFYVARVRRAGRRPSRRYVDLLLAGAREHGLPREHLALLESQPVAQVPLIHLTVPAFLSLLERVQRRGPRARALVDRIFELLH